MPRPPRSGVNKTSTKTTAKKMMTKKRATGRSSSRARKNELLLVTWAPIMPRYLIQGIAEKLYGSFFADAQERYLQVVAVRIDGHKVYGTCQEMYEAAPYMFAPLL